MILPNCPKCDLSQTNTLKCPKIRRAGVYYRSSDSKSVARFQCRVCGKYFSDSTFDPYYRKRERRKSEQVAPLLVSGVSQRRIAELLKIDRKTVARMLQLEAKEAEKRLFADLGDQKPIQVIEFDDLETFEHTKCKPLSVTIAVAETSRLILGFEISPMPARGHLAEISRKKYGYRKDERRIGRENLLKGLTLFAAEGVSFKTDQHPHYSASIQKIFPGALQKTFKGRKAKQVGQGELKEGQFDPLFSINHTLGQFRDNVKRLVRKTWCTTKRPDCLRAHMLLYAAYHNAKILKRMELAAAKGAS
jgi:transposase-like protein